MTDNLRDEYDIDYTQAKPNRFADGVVPGGRLVVLDPDVAAVFKDTSAVNAALRSLMPPAGGTTQQG